MDTRKRTLVLGIGNILLRDEGIGVRVIEYLRRLDLPDEVECVDGGTAGADLLEILCGRRRLIVIDAMDAGLEPGTMLEMGLEDLQAMERPQLSLHDLDLPQTLEMARLLGEEPEKVILLGIQPERVECGMELTERLSKQIPAIAAKVLSLINS